MSDLIDRQALRAEHGLGSDCHDCKRDMKSCQYDRDYSLMDFCEWLDDAPAASPWHRVEDELPKESNRYIVYLRQGTEMKTPDWMGGEPLSYVTEMGFNKEQMLWQNGDDAYNAILSAVDTKKDFHITHWTEKPEPPKEIMNE